MGRMRGVLFLLLAACGRLGFEARSGTPDTDAPIAGDAAVDAEVCISDPCTLVLPQCGCPEGKACHRTGATTETRDCVTEGTARADELCGGDDECVAGHVCIAQAVDSGRCHLYCAADSDCPPGKDCADLVEGVGVGICGSACTLEGGCPGNIACKVVLSIDFDSAGPVAFPLCADPNGAASGATCGSSLDCAGGLFCDDAGVCRPMCRFDGTLDCAAGTCTEALAPIVLGGVTHGFCR
jgi:hypothetical protein